MAGKQSDDLWWMLLFVLSKVCWVAWIMVSMTATIVLSSIVLWETQRTWLGIMTAFWCVIVSWVGLGFVEFSWNKVLLEDSKHTSVGETK
jgi:hypothetical protein